MNFTLIIVFFLATGLKGVKVVKQPNNEAMFPFLKVLRGYCTSYPKKLQN